MLIRPASTPGDYRHFAALSRQYVTWFTQRYESIPWFPAAIFGAQSLSQELADPAALYGPPHGHTLLAVDPGGTILAAGAFYRTGPHTCEMKRVFVTPQARGLGLGRRLVQALIQDARADGYHTLQLDTGTLLTEAIALYTSLGFTPCPPFHDYPANLLPHLVFLRLQLSPPGDTTPSAIAPPL